MALTECWALYDDFRKVLVGRVGGVIGRISTLDERLRVSQRTLLSDYPGFIAALSDCRWRARRLGTRARGAGGDGRARDTFDTFFV